MGFNTTWASLGAAQWLGRANSFTYFLPSHSRHSHREVVKALEWIYGCLDIQIILWNFSIFTFPRRTFAGKKGIFLVNIEATLNVKCEKKPLKISRQSGKWEQCEMLGVWRRTETSLTGIFSQNTGGGPTDGVLWDCSQHHHLTSLVTTHLSALSLYRVRFNENVPAGYYQQSILISFFQCQISLSTTSYLARGAGAQELDYLQ